MAKQTSVKISFEELELAVMIAELRKMAKSYENQANGEAMAEYLDELLNKKLKPAYYFKTDLGRKTVQSRGLTIECPHNREDNVYTDEHHNRGRCKMCGKIWKLELTPQGTALIYEDPYLLAKDAAN